MKTYRRHIAVWVLAGILTAGVAQGQPRPGSKADLAAAAFYAPDTVQTIHLRVEEKDLARQAEALPEQIYVPATFSWNGMTLRHVAVRYKGNSSAMPNQPFKRSFLVKFSEYAKQQRFLGLERVALDNGIQFGGLYSEVLILEVLRDLGVPVPRANHARVFLNGEYLGVYVNVERVDEAFVASHFGDGGNGMLYKVHTGGPGCDFGIPGDDPDIYAMAFEAKTHRKTANFRDLDQFIRAINETPDEAIAARLDAILELDDFLKMTAVLLLGGAFDQYTGWQAHNYYVYRDLSDGRWSYIPWDLDVGFVTEAFGHIPVLEGWNAAYPLPIVPRPLLERIVRDDGLLARYRAYAEEILERYFRPERLDARIDTLHELLREPLADDPFPPRRITVPTDTSYDDVVAGMKQFFQLRYDKARSELDEGLVTEPMDMAAMMRMQRERPSPFNRPGGPGGPGRPGGPGGPGGAPGPGGPQPEPGEASDQDPANLAVAGQEPGRVVLRWETRAEGAAAHIVQRAGGPEGAAFMNYRPVHGPVSQFEDTEVPAGTTLRYRVYAVWPSPDGTIRASGTSNEVTVEAR